MDNLTPAQRRKNMQRIRSSGTLPERIVMEELKKHRIRFQSYVRSLPGSPDIFFARKKVVLFIDSDFWHCNPRRFRMPVTNRKYWRSKISANRRRDKIVNRALKRMGYKVLRLWEFDIVHNWSRANRRLLEAIGRKAK